MGTLMKTNEPDAIAPCEARADAQYDYATEDRNKNGIPEYARKLISSPRKRDDMLESTDPAQCHRREASKPLGAAGHIF
jgi:Protein of unknown function (DUF2950)